MAKIVLDPGHGGPKCPPVVGGSSWNNAVGPSGTLEKTFTLAVAKAAKKALVGHAVSLTRDTDKNLSIAARAEKARAIAADVFVSIHFNAPEKDKPPAQGTETWIGVSPWPKSRRLANFVQAAVVGATGLRDRGVKIGAVSGVISNRRHHANTAHCLVEISFLNRQPDEERRLQSQDYIDRLGAAVAAGIESYLQTASQVGATPEYAPAVAPIPDAAFSEGLFEQFKQTAAGNALEEPPFIADRSSNKPFADLHDRGSVDDPNGMLEGWTAVFEAQVGDWNTVSASLLDLLARHRRAVARIIVPAGQVDYRNQQVPTGWSGTGFLVGKNLLLTNHHVINSIDVAGACEVEFEYEVPPTDLIAGRNDAKPIVKTFKVDPRRLFVTSPATGGLDYTFVWLEEHAATEFGVIPMERASFTTNRGESVFVIHHPRGRLKEASLDDTETLRIRSTVIHYAADTDYGSSGAPVFDRNGRLIALHHARNSDTPEKLTDGRTVVEVNEGVKMSAIALDLENRIKKAGADAGMAEAVLAEMKGSDTLASFFGGLGRTVRGATDVEAVVNVYTGTDQDVDIGFWNIEWLANRYTDREKLRGAATVITDMNLDIWGLSEVSPAAVEALVEELRSTFHEDYDYDLSEEEAAEGKQSTAVIWKKKSVTGVKTDWPEDIADLWGLDSRDPLPFEAVHGKIFNRYPGLFKFTIKDRQPAFDFFLVPLHLKAMAEGSLRRRLAAKLLVRAVAEMVKRGHDQDWILGGDFNATLASEDFQELQSARFLAMAAEDEADGGFSYLKSPKSLIDNIFLSPNFDKTAGRTDFFVVAKDKSVDKYVDRVSDHRPVLLRISLQETAGAAQPVDLDEVANALMAKAGRKKPKPKAAAKPTRAKKPTRKAASSSRPKKPAAKPARKSARTKKKRR